MYSGAGNRYSAGFAFQRNKFQLQLHGGVSKKRVFKTSRKREVALTGNLFRLQQF